MPQFWGASHFIFLALVSLTIAYLVGGEMMETLRRRAVIRLRGARRNRRR